MIGRPKIIRTAEEIKEFQKKKRIRYKNYFDKYNKYYYLRKILEDPNYNKKRKLREKELKMLKKQKQVK